MELLSGSGFPLRLLHVSTPQRNTGNMCCTKSDALQQFPGRVGTGCPWRRYSVASGLKKLWLPWHQDGRGRPRFRDVAGVFPLGSVDEVENCAAYRAGRLACACGLAN